MKGKEITLSSDDLAYELKVMLAGSPLISNKTLEVARDFYEFLETHRCEDDVKFHEDGLCSEASHHILRICDSICKDIESHIKAENNPIKLLAFRLKMAKRVIKRLLT